MDGYFIVLVKRDGWGIVFDCMRDEFFFNFFFVWLSKWFWRDVVIGEDLLVIKNYGNDW